jgi:predicted esterase
MTRQDRELAIADNLAYVDACMEAVAAEWNAAPARVFAGFSQGVAMAFRVAANCAGKTAVIANGNDIPPELGPGNLQRISGILIGRGTSDEWYTKEKLAEDERRLREANAGYRVFEFAGGHEWPADFSETASNFLAEFARS